MTLLIISNFILLGASMYLWGRHQFLVRENNRLLTDNSALRDKVLARHGFTPLHEPVEARVSRQEQSISLVPPIHAVIAAEEAAEEEADRQYWTSTLSEEKKAELMDEARRRAG